MKAYGDITEAAGTPAIAKVFPTSEAVNAALLGLLTLTDQTARITGRSKRSTRKSV